MKKIILALMLFVLNTSLGYSAPVNGNRFIHLGQDGIGGHWYLDERDIHIDAGIVDFDIIADIVPSYRQHLIDWLKNSFADDPQRAHDIANDTTKMSQQYLWDVEQSLFCLKNVFFYDANQRLLYSHSFSAFDNWYPISSNPIIGKAIEWIRINLLAQQYATTRTVKPIAVPSRKDVNNNMSNLSNQPLAKPTNTKTSSQTTSVNSNTNNLDASSIILLTLIGGVLTSAVLVVMYNHLTSTKSFNNASTQDTLEINHDSSSTSDNAEYDFNYPYEDIRKVTGM